MLAEALVSGRQLRNCCRGALIAAAALAGCAGPLPDAAPERTGPRVSHGPVVGGIGPRGALLWARGERSGWMHVELAASGRRVLERSVPVDAERDFTGQIPLEGLRPGVDYHYRVWFRDPGSDGGLGPERDGRFRTAPARHDPRPVRVAFGGDLAGQNLCRDAREGFPIFEAVEEFEPDLFIGLGDMIYADHPCLEVSDVGNPQVPGGFGPATDLSAYWAHWRYAREDAAFGRLLASTAYVAVWDDHEVVNNFGPDRDTRDRAPYTPDSHLMPIGLQAFLDHNPVSGSAPGRLYRSLRWGRHLELFVLDTRSYRDPAPQPDHPRASKSMLGAEQRAWLEAGLASSDATWKVIVTSVPLSIPSGVPRAPVRDSWADFESSTGYEQELAGLMRFLRARGLRDVIFLAADVHMGAVFRYTPFPDTPEFRAFELVTGPLNARPYPNHHFDTTLGTERLFFFGPDPGTPLTSWVDVRSWFNFGTLEVDPAGRLAAGLRDVEGRPLYRLELDPPAPR